MPDPPATFDWTAGLPCIDAGRVILRPLDERDVPALLRIFGDPEVMRYWSSLPLADRAAAAELLRGIQDHFRARTLFQWGVARPGHDAAEDATAPATEVIGTCTLHRLSWADHRAEIGFALGRAEWGKGLMNEALTALVGLAFAPAPAGLGLARLEADVDPRNDRSIRILERQGFRREGQLRERHHLGGEAQDAVIYGLLRREWPGGHEPSHARRRGSFRAL